MDENDSDSERLETFEGVMKRRKARSMSKKRANAQVQLEKALARAQELGVELRPLPEGVKGSVKGALRALVGPSEAWGVAHQILAGANDPENPRQLDYISRLKEWIDGLETQKSERSEVQRRVVLNLDGVDAREASAPREVVAESSEVLELRARCERLEAQLRLLGESPRAASPGQRTEPDVVPPVDGGDCRPLEHPRS